MLLGYFLASFHCFVKTSIFSPLNRNDDLKESGVGVGVGVGVGLIGILGVGVGVGILGKLGVGVGPYNFRLCNPGRNTESVYKICLKLLWQFRNTLQYLFRELLIATTLYN